MFVPASRLARPFAAFIGALTMVLSLALVPGTAADATQATSSARAEQFETVAQARAATARYHDVQTALTDGYVPAGPCVEMSGMGAMGIHYVNHDLLADGVIDVARPELLLYLPDRHGRQRLVGIEYMQIDADQDLSTDDDRPWLFGVPFDGPMDGHGPGEPVHYDLHVWLWSHNPAGTFAMFNPVLSCGDGADGHAPH
jgi:hypothetical protein